MHILNNDFGIPIYISSTIFVMICYITFKRNIEGVVKISEILVPALILFILFLGIKNIPSLINETNNIQIIAHKKNWILSSLLYASYNSIILIPVLTSLREYVTSKKQIIKISIISSLIIIILALLIYSMLLTDTFFISQLDMPLMHIVFNFGNIFKYLYGFIIIISIFTSAISTGCSFLKNVSKNKSTYNFVLLLICISSIFISNIGFSTLVQILYPTFGVFGLLQIILLFKINKIY